MEQFRIKIEFTETFESEEVKTMTVSVKIREDQEVCEAIDLAMEKVSERFPDANFLDDEILS